MLEINMKVVMFGFSTKLVEPSLFERALYMSAIIEAGGAALDVSIAKTERLGKTSSCGTTDMQDLAAVHSGASSILTRMKEGTDGLPYS